MSHSSVWQIIREGLASLWRSFIVCPGIGAASAQGVVAVIGWLPILWGFPPPDEVQVLAYPIGYLIGLCYGIVVIALWFRRTFQNCQKRGGTRTSPSQPACTSAKCCRCKPAGS